MQTNPLEHIAPSLTCLTGIILAGGKSSRMGTDKGLISFNGKPLVRYAIDVLNPYCKQILISTNNRDYEQFGYPIVNDLHIQTGPMGGIHAGLLASHCAHHMVLSCDMPFVDEELVATILNQSMNARAVMPFGNGDIVPVCAYYNIDILPELEYHLENNLLKMKLFVKRLNPKIVKLKSAKEAQKLININNWDELKTYSTEN